MVVPARRTRKRDSEGIGDTHGREDTEKERVVDAVKCLGGIGEHKDTWEANAVSIVGKRSDGHILKFSIEILNLSIRILIEKKDLT